MRDLLLFRSTLLLVLMASVATAKGRDPVVRNVYLRDDPKDEAERVYVAGQVVTVLRFQRPCDPERTKMLGWEGRFEPVECAGKRVLLDPLQNLETEDRFMLLVTLADGKEIPFTVTAPDKEEWARTDQQVNVFLDPETPAALRTQLEDTRARARMLEDTNRRHWEQDTEDHALAKLVVSGAIRQTSFVERQKWILKGRNADIVARVYSGKGKAAVLFSVTNRHPSKSWSLSEARVKALRPGERDPEPPLLFNEARPFALRAGREEIAPGETGQVAVVVDKSAFKTENGSIDLGLELYRQDGLMDAFVVLDDRLAR